MELIAAEKRAKEEKDRLAAEKRAAKAAAKAAAEAAAEAAGEPPPKRSRKSKDKKDKDLS
jgi:hypothetical protein